METETKRPILAIIIGILALLVFSIAVSYAFFTANFGGGETTTSISVTGGTLFFAIDGVPAVTVNNVIPDNSPAASKSFTVTADNTTVDMPLQYEIALVVTQNSFSSNAITYTMSGANTSANGAQALTIFEHQYLLTGTSESILGRGYFDPGLQVSHTYNLNVFFRDTGFPQNENQGKVFKAHVILRNPTQGS